MIYSFVTVAVNRITFQPFALGNGLHFILETLAPQKKAAVFILGCLFFFFIKTEIIIVLRKVLL
jgi:hypothetical protein